MPRQLPHNKKLRKIRLAGLVALGVICCALAVLVWDWARLVRSHSRERAEQEHGVFLPVSAAAFQCRGNALTMVGDRGASTVFEMAASDVAAFKAGVALNPGRRTFVPGNDAYRAGLVLPWSAAAPLETWSCDSPVGDWLHVEIWPISSARVGVWMYTDWN